MKNSLLILVISFQLFFGFICSNAKIVYKSIDSTVIASETDITKSYPLDMNDDGINDFSLRHENSNGYLACYIFGAGEPSLSEIQVNSNSTAFACIDGDIISENPVDEIYHYYGMAALDGTWKGNNDLAVAIRFKINSQYHYGWIKTDVPIDASNIYIKECAYEDTPGQSIESGRKVTSVFENNKNDDFNIESNNELLVIKYNKSNCEHLAGKIYNINGCCIYSFQSSGNSEYINTINFDSGLYFLCIELTGKHYSMKFMIN